MLFVGLLDYFLKKFEFTLDILPDLRTNSVCFGQLIKRKSTGRLNMMFFHEYLLPQTQNVFSHVINVSLSQVKCEPDAS